MKTFVVSFTCLCILCIAILPAMAEENSKDLKLYSVSTFESADHTNHYYSAKSEGRDGNSVKIWETLSYSETEELYKNHKNLWEFNCSKKQARMIESYATLRDGERKVPLKTSEAVREIPRNSKLEELYAIACEKPKYAKADNK